MDSDEKMLTYQVNDGPRFAFSVTYAREVAKSFGLSEEVISGLWWGGCAAAIGMMFEVYIPGFRVDSVGHVVHPSDHILYEDEYDH